MAEPDQADSYPSSGALAEVRRLAGPDARIGSVVRLEGGQEADTWRVDTIEPDSRLVVREFPAGSTGAQREQSVLRALDGLDGYAPVALGGDLGGAWSPRPTSLIGWLDGEADITPDDPRPWATELGRALAATHGTPTGRLEQLPRILAPARGARDRMTGPLAAGVRERWGAIAEAAEVLTHSDYWSGNVVWRDTRLTGIVDWAGAARGPRGYDIGWCRLDLVLLYDGQIADVFLDAYRAHAGHAADEVELWDAWAAARSHEIVDTWAPNYGPLGREDLTGPELRRRHTRWSAELLARQ